MSLSLSLVSEVVELRHQHVLKHWLTPGLVVATGGELGQELKV